MKPKKSNLHQKRPKLRHWATRIRVSERPVPSPGPLTGPWLRQSGGGGAPLRSTCLRVNSLRVFWCVPVSEHKCSSESSVLTLRVYLRASNAFGPCILRATSELLFFFFLSSSCDFCVILIIKKKSPEVKRRTLRLQTCESYAARLLTEAECFSRETYGAVLSSHARQVFHGVR